MSNTPVHTTGYGATASTTGNEAAASTTGNGTAASTTGYRATASTTGYGATASTTGYEAAAFAALGSAESARSVAVGRWVRLGPDSNAAVVLPDDERYRPEVVSVNDGWSIGVWITMQDGWIVERPDVLLYDDGRGYMLVHDWETDRYQAGCRNFTAEQAVKHWSDTDHQAPDSAARLLAAVWVSETKRRAAR